MTKPIRTTGTTRIQRKLLLKLVRQCLRGACQVSPAEGGLRVSGSEEHTYPEVILREAQSRGLVRWEEGRITASKAAAGFLRRMMLESGEPYADQHRDLVDAVVQMETGRQSVRRNTIESPLGAIARLKDRDGGLFLPVEAVDAGERLLSDFTRGQLQPRITASWEPRLSARTQGAPGGQGEIADSAMAARDRFSRALDAMGPELAGVAVDVCCFSKGLELVERERQWPARSAKLMLRTALLALARHYAPPPVRGRKSHHWGSEDYRPVL
jgi:hypothetical protein